MERRSFIRNAAIGGAAMAALPGILSATAANPDAKASNKARFNLKYAPGLGTFREHAGNDPIDEIRFMHDQGFRAIFDNGFMGKEPALQEKIANELARLGMDFGPYVLYADFGTKSMVTRDPEVMEMLKNRVKAAVELQKRTGAGQALMVPGRFDERLHWDYQTANVIDSMRMICEIAGPSNLVIVLEPLNGLRDHPGLFLTTIPQSYMICKAVNHPSCRIVNDLYHQQITEGNLIPNMDAAWEYIAAFHCGDHPGRREPGTGEINYLNVFKHIHSKGYDGVICMEHGRSIPGKEGEKALIEAYRKVDAFEV
jgi:hydroxypyruvate isomerase